MTEYIELPEIFPLDDIVVKDEQHLFEVFEGDNGPLPKTEYTLDKAPISEIEKVTGTISGAAGYEFEKGVDYELSADAEAIFWLNGGDRPDAGTTFYVTYRTDSIIGRYIGSSDDELEKAEERIIDATQGKFLDKAEGNELDEIGELFGDTIGKRQNRTDTQYRIYLKSVVQSFISRGTRTGIKLAVSAATDVPISEITIDEDFEKNEYEVIVVPNTPVTVSVIEEIAEIADPSGVRQIRTRFPFFEDVGIDDSGDPDEFADASITDNVSIDDANANFNNSTTDDMAVNDSATLRPKSAVLSDSMSADDSTANSTAITGWDVGSWESMNWATEIN